MNLGLLEISGFDADHLEGASYDFRVGPKATVTTASRPLDSYAINRKQKYFNKAQAASREISDIFG